jgi:hypothetical protein
VKSLAICIRCGKPLRTGGLSQLARQLAVPLPTGYQSIEARDDELRAKIIEALCQTTDAYDDSARKS